MGKKLMNILIDDDLATGLERARVAGVNVSQTMRQLVRRWLRSRGFLPTPAKRTKPTRAKQEGT